MKRIVIIAIACLFGSMIQAQSPNQSQERQQFITQAKRFLTEEGFIATYDDEDASLNFKKEGRNYWIEFQDDDKPFYLRYHCSGFSTEDSDIELVYEACNQANVQVLGGKATVGDKVVMITVEYFCNDIESFRRTFYKSMRALDLTRQKTIEAYQASQQ